MTHWFNEDRQYSTKKASAYSWPWPFPKRPCVSVHVTRCVFCRSTSKYSRTSLLICAFGHHAPPFFSCLILKQKLKFIILPTAQKFRLQETSMRSYSHWCYFLKISCQDFLYKMFLLPVLNGFQNSLRPI